VVGVGGEDVQQVAGVSTKLFFFSSSSHEPPLFTGIPPPFPLSPILNPEQRAGFLLVLEATLAHTSSFSPVKVNILF